ncbi:MAG: hypothetical protein QXJ68_08235 [Methanocellales archaeon]
MKVDQIRREEIDESIEKGAVFTIMNREEARYAIAKVVSIIEEKNLLGKFLPMGRRTLGRVKEAEIELMKIFDKQLKHGKVYPRTSRDSIIAFIGGYIACLNKNRS